MNPAHPLDEDRMLFWYQVNSGRFRPPEAPLEPGRNGSSAPPLNHAGTHLALRLATREEREAIYRLRHEVYARELGQYAVRPDRRLTDALDAFNIYLVAFDGKDIIGFVSITPPGHDLYSVDKYLKREQLPFPVDDKLYEVRILTIPETARRRMLALLLMLCLVSLGGIARRHAHHGHWTA